MVIAVTNRNLCSRNLDEQVADIVSSPAVSAVIVREKDLELQEYLELGRPLKSICQEHGKQFIVNHSVEAAERLDADCLHLPEKNFLRSAGEGDCGHLSGEKSCEHLSEAEFLYLEGEAAMAFEMGFGVSVHSKEVALMAAAKGAQYILYGHVYTTDCKPGLAARGLSLLKEICDAVTIPVYAIGGITPENASQVFSAGASKICLMSSLMESQKPLLLLNEFAASYKNL